MSDPAATPQALAETSVYSLDGVSPQIDPTAWVAPGARLMGKIVLEAETSVWFNAVLRGDNEEIRICERSNIQDGAVLHTDMGCPLVVEPDCTVGHMAMLHGCTIKQGALIGMGATVLNNAVIGEGCLVGANALVTEGSVFEAGWLILGAPAKAVKKLDDKNRDRIVLGSRGYVMNAKRFRNGLKPA